MTKKEEIMRLVKEVEKNEPKGIHLLVNNAGIARDDNTKYSNGKPDFKVRLVLFFRTISCPELSTSCGTSTLQISGNAYTKLLRTPTLYQNTS